MNKLSIIGAGNWATTLAVVLARKGVRVSLHSVFDEHNLQMQRERENVLYLKGTRFPSLLTVEPSLAGALRSPVVIIAIPVKFLPKVLKQIASQKIDLSRTALVSVSKGIEAESLKRPSELIRYYLKSRTVAVLSGPNIAGEVLAGIPSTAILACSDVRLGKKLQLLFTSPSFRVYLHTDVVGVELGGALKNVIALACGISDGLGFGSNTKAALVTRGLAEITRLGVRLGAQGSTFWGISGLGDLVTTCFSPQSRNRTVGEKIGRGQSIEAITGQMKMVAEGVETVKSALRLGNKLKVELPIIKEVYSVLYKGKTAKKAVSDLMSRPPKAERIG